MPWYEKDQPTPFDEQPISGLFFLDGDVLAAYLRRDWTKGEKYPMIAFPSGLEREVWESSREEGLAVVHLFGEMDLPLKADRNSAFVQAYDIAEQVGYMVHKVGENGLELWGHDADEHLMVTYDLETGMIADVVQVREEQPSGLRPMELLTDEIRAQLPQLYANEELGLAAPVPVKFFTPDANWTWYASEFDGEDIFFGLVIGREIELGYFSLTELQSVRGPLGLPIERDRFFTPATLAELKKQHEDERRSRGEG